MATLDEIENSAKQYRLSCDILRNAATEQEEKIKQIKEEYAPRLKTAATDVALWKASLTDQVKASPGLFKKPKTLVIFGIKVGFQKGRGITVFNQPVDKVITRIKRMFKRDASRYVKTKETLKISELGNLPAADLKKLGVVIQETGDSVVVKIDETDTDKLIAALLAEAQGQLAPAADEEEN